MINITAKGAVVRLTGTDPALCKDLRVQLNGRHDEWLAWRGDAIVGPSAHARSIGFVKIAERDALEVAREDLAVAEARASRRNYDRNRQRAAQARARVQAIVAEREAAAAAAAAAAAG